MDTTLIVIILQVIILFILLFNKIAKTAKRLWLAVVERIAKIRKNKTEEDKAEKIEEDDTEETEQEYKSINFSKNPDEYNNLSNRQLLKAVVKDIGGSIIENKVDKRFIVEYQGERFLLDTPRKSNFVILFDTWWHEIDLSNLEHFSIMREAINNVNASSHSATLLYSLAEEEGRVGLHCKAVFPFHAQIPDLQSYLRFYLNDTLEAHQSYYRATEEIRQSQNMDAEKV